MGKLRYSFDSGLPGTEGTTYKQAGGDDMGDRGMEGGKEGEGSVY